MTRSPWELGALSGVALMLGVTLAAGCSTSTTAPQDPVRTSAAPPREQVATPQPHPSAMAACAQELGWDAQVSVRGDAVITTVPDDNFREYQADRAWCASALGPPTEPGSSGRAGHDLEAWESVGQCLTALDFPTDPLPENVEEIEASWLSGNPIWNPYYAAAHEGRLVSAVEACPPPR